MFKISVRTSIAPVSANLSLRDESPTLSNLTKIYRANITLGVFFNLSINVTRTSKIPSLASL